ncbi:LytTR family DNA-binding domain-containing protein [Desulfobotulus sp. H1]|uniref:LytTR family DNA-binding domain-containing protein n=1 Tax=Desulfobotulus pelophilus TaxID=2823377 RepID=A0ABT3N7M6_9BACT|nr:LytTR family DNA-binding domain-containing protein [Desulfobotulus pelophilus]MCW7753453.1 LytTR family DNA-binding domain-containing protein [Desulfobotulus pelophilus]
MPLPPPPYESATVIRTLLVDDEPPALDELAYLLSAIENVEIVGTASSGGKAVAMIREMEPDLVFLDIQMPGKSGFEVLADIVQMACPPFVVFSTAYDQYAIRAFEENAVDYLLKPVSLDRLRKTVERICRLLGGSRGEQAKNREDAFHLRTLLAVAGIGPEIARFSVECDGRNVLLNPRDVLFFQSTDKRVHAHTEGGDFACPSDLSLEKIEERLQSFFFFRANRSQLVNLAFVRSYAPWFNGKYVATLSDSKGTDITISKARVRAFRAAIEL